MSPGSSLLVADRIGRRAPGADWLVHEVSLQLRPGERLVLSGPTGAGKSVLLRSLALLDPLDEGEILWHGKAVSPHEVPGYRSQVVYLHQRPALLEGSVESNLRFPFTFDLHRDRTLDVSQAEGWLHQFGRDASFLDRLTRDLSGGEQQITAIIRALAIGPRVLLLDEPTAALDPDTTYSVETVVNGWVQEAAEDRAFIWVSHDRAQAERMAGRRLELQGGRLVGGAER